MRRIEIPASFRRDFKRELRGIHQKTLENDLKQILDVLVSDLQVTERYRDHHLTGEWTGCRECHIKPDLLLIYRKAGDDRLILIRLGSHSELFG